MGALSPGQFFRTQVVNPIPGLADSYEHSNLPEDPYCTNSCRFRRYSRFQAVPMGVSPGWHIRRLPHRCFKQTRFYNRFVGDVERRFEPITFRIEPFVARLLSSLEFDKGVGWRLGVHQIRVCASGASLGTVVPEGPHRDGYKLVCIYVVDRHNIEGGVSEIWDLNSDTRLYREVLDPGSVMVVDDQSVRHLATDIAATADEGYRDTLILTCDPWDGPRRS